MGYIDIGNAGKEYMERWDVERDHIEDPLTEMYISIASCEGNATGWGVIPQRGIFAIESEYADRFIDKGKREELRDLLVTLWTAIFEKPATIRFGDECEWCHVPYQDCHCNECELCHKHYSDCDCDEEVTDGILS